MATKSSKNKNGAESMDSKLKGGSGVVALGVEESGLDPAEEKMLDWILKGVVAFILGWLGLSILMVVGGYFGIWS